MGHPNAASETMTLPCITRRGLLHFATSIGAAFGSAAIPTLGFAQANTQSNGVESMQIDTGRSALLLLHYQSDILSIFAEAGIDAYVARMASLAQKARKAGVPVFFVKIGFTADYREISPNNKRNSERSKYN